MNSLVRSPGLSQLLVMTRDFGARAVSPLTAAFPLTAALI